jgi:predicted RNA-binding Zn-ribbon protein involved in translation (DUF1610 family)
MIIPKSKSKPLTCPNCGEVILRSERGENVLRNRILILDQRGAMAKCKQCGSMVKVPIRMVD